MDPNWLLEKIALLIPLALSLSVHEMAHARTALAFGDPTAKNMGRCTLNPLAHLDPIGTLALVLIGFGWAKPVPVNVNNLHPRKWGDIAVSIAGPLSNLMLAVLAALALRFALKYLNLAATNLGQTVFGLAMFTIVANLSLFAFNMLPLYPLDGHHIFREQLPADMQAGFMQWQIHYGRLVLMALIFVPMLLAGTQYAFIDPLGWGFRHLMNVAVKMVLWQ